MEKRCKRFCLLAVALVLTVGAQAPRPHFDAISIQLMDPRVAPRAWAIHTTPTRLTTPGARLRDLILEAYAVDDFQLSGGPGWMDTDVFAVTATSDQPVSIAVMRQMLQQALADRFQLQVVVTTKPSPVYALTPMPGGAHVPKRGDRNAPVAPGTVHMVVATSADRFVAALNAQKVMDHPIVDETGLAGDDYAFGYSVYLAPDSADPRAGGQGVKLDSPHGKGFTALLEKQLGLTMVLKNADLTMVAVKSVQQPSKD